MNPSTFNRVRDRSQADFEAFVAWLSKTTLAELRAAHGDLQATRTAFLVFFQRGLRAELLLDELLQILFSQPAEPASIFYRVGYTTDERPHLVEMIKGFTVEEIRMASEGRVS